MRIQVNTHTHPLAALAAAGTQGLLALGSGEHHAGRELALVTCGAHKKVTRAEIR